MNAESMGWEGVMLRKDAPYKGKRSNDILKVKKMHDEEYIVKDIEYGPFRIVDKELKQEVTGSCKQEETCQRHREHSVRSTKR